MYLPMLAGAVAEIRCAGPYTSSSIFISIPDIVVEDVFGIDDLPPPQAFGNIGRYPPEFVAAIGEGFGGGRLGEIVASRWRGEGVGRSHPYPAAVSVWLSLMNSMSLWRG